ncbi:hypothetical protein LNTAR_15037 [Lentisphaera araneosa HTCC2155]|uniref:Uncharacterized protein n=1 Tax=Lentisphaera araneosa HTCC2155 TaxID=313628 RepID=A6DRD2_9BACT|nr:hypothetical protein [Lentisphaera araneosa]EDM25742.1 hypothetical protein LNTAR_15037 [Lentisphaera araneosa HTCC2155]
MQKHRAYFEKRYQLRLEDITLQSVIDDPLNTEYLRGNDLINGERRWIKFHSEEFLDCFYKKSLNDLYWTMSWGEQS